jgi:7-keto-8-aminopelargonate synthetase-like enzyme
LRAAAHALRVNDRSGDALRSRLAGAVRHFRTGATAVGYSPAGGGFPVQALAVGSEAIRLHAHLREQGVNAALHNGNSSPPRLSFLFNAKHPLADLDEALDAATPAFARTGS